MVEHWRLCTMWKPLDKLKLSSLMLPLRWAIWPLVQASFVSLVL